MDGRDETVILKALDVAGPRSRGIWSSGGPAFSNWPLHVITSIADQALVNNDRDDPRVAVQVRRL